MLDEMFYPFSNIHFEPLINIYEEVLQYSLISNSYQKLRKLKM